MTDSDEELIDTLPDEILEAVFRYISLEEVKTKLAVVCKRWYEVSKSCSLLRTLEFGPFITTDTAIQVGINTFDLAMNYIRNIFQLHNRIFTDETLIRTKRS